MSTLRLRSGHAFPAVVVIDVCWPQGSSITSCNLVQRRRLRVCGAVITFASGFNRPIRLSVRQSIWSKCACERSTMSIFGSSATFSAGVVSRFGPIVNRNGIRIPMREKRTGSGDDRGTEKIHQHGGMTDPCRCDMGVAPCRRIRLRGRRSDRTQHFADPFAPKMCHPPIHLLTSP